MSKPQKIMIAMPVLLLGGTEIHTLSLVRLLVDAGYHVMVCCYYEFDSSMVSQMERMGANVILMKLKRTNGLFYLAKQLLKLSKELRPDIVHVQYLAPGLVPIIAARIARVPTVFATVHIAGSIAYGRKAIFLLRLAAQLCMAFFCVSKGVEEFWFGNSLVLNPENIQKGRKHFTIYNAVDVVRITQIVDSVNREEFKKSLSIDERPLIGIVGRLAHQKGHAVLLDAMPKVIKHFPNVVLLVIGKGPEREFLGKKADELSIGRHILWLGERSQEDVFRLYSVMDIFVTPSLYEGFGLTAAEAMAARLPVVGTNIEGLSEVIENNVCGYLVPVNNSNELAKAIITLLTDSEKAKAMGMNGHERVKECFSTEKFSRSWLAAYSGLQNVH